MSGKGGLSFKKSYRLLHFLNRQHGLPMRAFMACSGFAGALIVNSSPTLARQLSREFWLDNFKDGLRRAHWYATRGWPGLGAPVSDPFFCFSDGLDLKESQAVLKWIEGRTKHLPPLEADSANLVANAQVIQQLVLTGRQEHARPALHQFYCAVDRLISSLQSLRDQPLQAANDAGHKTDGNGRSGDFAQDDAEQALKDVARLLPLEKWGWTALSGTFLGIFREGDFLPHDFDIDLGLQAKQTDVEALQQVLRLAPEFESVRLDQQYRLYETNSELKIEVLPVLVKAVHRNGIAVDFSLLHEDNGVWWHGSMMHRWDHSPMELVEYRLRGVTILGPRDGDRYLTEGYGDWRTPVKEFNCSSGRYNLMVVRNLLGLCLFLKRLVWHLEQVDVAGFDALIANMHSQGVLVPVQVGGAQGSGWVLNRKWLK